jgi:hypothetical protein
MDKRTNLQIRKHDVAGTESVSVCRRNEGGTLLDPLVTWPELRLALSKEPNRRGISFHSPEDKNMCSFRNIVFSRYSEFRTMNKVQKSSDSETDVPLNCQNLELNFAVALGSQTFHFHEAGSVSIPGNFI